MFPFLRLGPILLQLPGLALLAGVWVGSYLADKEATRLKLKAATISNLIFYGLVAGIVGARLGYAVRYLSTYLANPLGLLALTPATLSPRVGVVIGAAVAVWFGRRKKLPLRPTLDALAPGLAAFLVGTGMSHILSGDAFGSATSAPWAIYLWDERRHPSQVYETIAALLVFVVEWRRPLGRPGEGANFLLVVALSAAARVFLEAFRGDSLIWPGGFRAAQVIALVVFAAACRLILAWMRPNLPRPRSGGKAVA
ncbi:MAG: prolipoprotein diacylglyceryl transferase [Anaerolineales bacterium]